jgi:hypothetical protein
VNKPDLVVKKDHGFSGGSKVQTFLDYISYAVPQNDTYPKGST